jgi:protein disulfide-isomerase
MVALGLGSLLFAIFAAPKVGAEMPRYVSASGIPTTAPVFWHKSLESGWDEARRRDVPMVIYITSDDCQYCEAMKRDTWCDHTIGQRLSQDFVAIRLNPKENASTINRIKLKMFPATLIGLPQGKIIDHRYGYQPSREIHQVLSNAKARRVARR